MHPDRGRRFPRGMSPPEPPRAAFVVAAYDAADTLEETVRSALAQSDPRVEVVVVDDGSRDATAEVAARMAAADARVRVVRRANGGPGAARNSGLALATAPYVCFLDADDLVPPGKVAAQAAVLDADPALAVVYSGCDAGGTAGEAPRLFPVETDGDALSRALLEGADAAFPVHAALARRSAVGAVGAFRERRPLVEDLDLWVRLAAAGARFRHAPDPRVLYRGRAGSRSTRAREVLEGLVPVHEWLAAHLPPDPPERREAVRLRLRWRILALAGHAAADGRGARARGLVLRSLRWARRPGEWAEALRLFARPPTAPAP